MKRKIYEIHEDVNNSEKLDVFNKLISQSEFITKSSKKYSNHEKPIYYEVYLHNSGTALFFEYFYHNTIKKHSIKVFGFGKEPIFSKIEKQIQDN